MNSRTEIKYVLPPYRIKLLGYLILSLFVFLIYSILKIQGEIHLSSLILLTTGLIIVISFWRFIKKYYKSGFLIQDEGIFLLNGSLLCKTSSIEAVDTSPYSFKSTNGFIIRLKESTSLAWSPGLFWKFKKRISIGGLVTKSESKWLSTSIITTLAEYERVKQTSLRK